MHPGIRAAPFLAAAAAAAGALPAQAGAPPRGFGAVAPLVDEACAGCHDDLSRKGGLDLFARQQPDRADLAVWLDTLRLVQERVAAGEMPPPGAERRLDAGERQRLVGFCRATLRRDVPHLPPAPGRVTVRRLSRAEWQFTVVDLFGVRTDAAAAFPADDLGYGFDNIGDALSFSTLHLEKYLAAAADVAAEVFHGEDPAAPAVRRVAGEVMRPVGRGIDQGRQLALLTTQARVEADMVLPRDGVYRLRVHAGADQAGDEPARMAVSLDGRPLDTFDIEHRDLRTVELTSAMAGGPRVFALAFVNDHYEPDHPDESRRDRNLRIDWLEVTGPLDARLVPDQQEWLVAADRPERAGPERLRGILRELLPRLWRRRTAAEEELRLLRIGEQVLEQGGPFHEAARRCLQAALASPHFLFRLEPEVRDGSGGKGAAEPLAGEALAVRLSYFVWSSAPDAELLELGAAGRLADDGVLAAQVLRLLADPRAERLATNFAAQWLELRALGEIMPDPDAHPGFDAELRRSLRRESELLFLAVLREGLDVRTLLDCDFTHVDARLARFYGIDGGFDASFRRVALPAWLRERGGVLGHAGVHAITSNPLRTSPVKRGKWILENLLGQAPPPPPPGNDSFADEGAAAAAPAGLREQMALHRSKPVCASCHLRMDALGLALESYDAIGRRRTGGDGGAVDDRGELPDGRRLEGLPGLKAALRGDPAFVRTLARKLFVYAVGREPGTVDRLRLDHAVDALLEGGRVRVADLVLAVVRSEAFLRRAR